MGLMLGFWFLVEGHEGQMVIGLDIEQRWCTGLGGGDEWG